MTPLAQAPSRKGVWLFCTQGLSDRYPTFWVSGSTPCFTINHIKKTHIFTIIDSIYSNNDFILTIYGYYNGLIFQ